MKTFGQAGAGIVAAPIAIEDEMRRHYGMVRVGEAEGIEEHVYAISGERKLKNPAVVAISRTARGILSA
jgi:LysR family transcriptional activator of nhaA